MKTKKRQLKTRKPQFFAETLEDSLVLSDGFTLALDTNAEGLRVFYDAVKKHTQEGLDVLTISAPIIKATDSNGQELTGELKDITDKIQTARINFKTTFAPGSRGDLIECVIAGELAKITLNDLPLNERKSFKMRLAERNKATGYAIPEGLKLLQKDQSKPFKFKRSGHLTDQILKYNYPKDKNPQTSLFDGLQDRTKKDIIEKGISEVTEIVEGIKLSPPETKIIDCLCKLLHEKSQTLDPKKDGYYTGNAGYELEPYGDKGEITPAPKLAFTLYELTKEYLGGEYVGGKDIENVKQLLRGLDSKSFLLSYIETIRKPDGGRIEKKIEAFEKLIKILKLTQTEYTTEDVELSKQEETVIALHPIFRRQIDSKFILYPSDINRRTFIAYGSHMLSDISLRLRDYLMRELSSKHYTPEIMLDRLYWLLAEKWMKESRKKKVKEFTDRAIETVINLGLLKSYEIVTGATGEDKVVFSLNKDWE